MENSNTALLYNTVSFLMRLTAFVNESISVVVFWLMTPFTDVAGPREPRCLHRQGVMTQKTME